MKLIKNAAIIPLQGTMDSFTGGVYSHDGQFIEDSLLERGKPAQIQKTVETLSGTYIYGGCLFGHFGHFIWESLSRLHAIRSCKNYPILFISPNNTGLDSQKLFLKNIGVKNEICVVKKTTSVENLIYASPGSAINPPYISDEQLKALQYFNFPELTDKRIWLSRSLLKFRIITNEPSIETEIAKLGYEIVHPENLPFMEQVKLISASKIIAGFEGSQFFSFLFSKKIHGKFFIFNRRRDIPELIQYSLARSGIEFNQYKFDLDPVNEEWPVSTYHHPAPEKIIEILDIKK